MILGGDSVGNDAGWHLRFFTLPAPGLERQVLSVGAGDYYADIEATTPSGLGGGTYRFVVEGITNSDYKGLHQTWNLQPRVPLYVDLFLYWRDTGGPLGYLASVAGLGDTIDSLAGTPDPSARVARLVVTRLSRRAGARRFEATIEARERIYDALAKRVDDPPAPGADPVASAADLADQLLKRARLTGAVEPHALAGAGAAAGAGGPGGASGDASPKHEPRANETGLSLLATLEKAMIAQSKRTGRGMYLIRDGRLHVGPGRPIPLAGNAKALDDAHGLVNVETSAVSLTEQADDPTGDAPPSRLQYSLTLKGRPDLRPGDTVTFSEPFRDDAGELIDPSGLAGASGIPSSFGDALAGLGSSLLGGGAASGLLGSVQVYVSGVSHRLSRTAGFVTTVTGVRVSAGNEWDKVSRRDGTIDPDPPATPHEEVASAIQNLVRSSGPEPLTVAEVRAAHLAGAAEPPGQTVDVWMGLAPTDGGPRGARRLAIDRRTKQRLGGLPYATPFAWGKCGLVLPRYPGTRVLVGHAGGVSDEPIDVGALWESGHGPDSQAGDWWLILPAAVESSRRRSLSDADTPQEPSQKATNDLIDADGARVIEVGRLTVRVRPSKLDAPGVRPAAPSDSAEQVTIEHESGSRIVIRDNGDIVIDSTNNLTLTTKHTMTLEADDVQVKVKNAMDVGDR